MVRLCKLVLLTLLGIWLIAISQVGLTRIAQAGLEPAAPVRNLPVADNHNGGAPTGLVTGTAQEEIEPQDDDERPISSVLAVLPAAWVATRWPGIWALSHPMPPHW